MSYNNGPKIVTNGLVLCLDAGNIKSYNGSGTTWFDLSRNGHSATAVNSPTFTSAGHQSYWSLNGTNQYFSSTGSDNYADLFAIIYLSSTQPTLPMLFSQAGVDKSLRFESGGLRTTTDNNDWNYNENAKVFINGVFDQTGVSIYDRWACIRSFRSNNTFTNPFSYQISGVYSSSRYFAGRINMLLAYNRELSSAEVLRNYTATKSRFALP
jgi:hypothetical protein